MPYRFKKLGERKGFTLIEILIAVAIVGIICTIAITRYIFQIRMERVRPAVNDIIYLRRIVQLYYGSKGKYIPYDLNSVSGGELTAGYNLSRKLSHDYIYQIETYNTSANFDTAVRNGTTDIIPIRITATSNGTGEQLIYRIVGDGGGLASNININTNDTREWGGALAGFTFKDPKKI